MGNNILVSCSVLSYNSAKTILETLESIKAQTYQNIELIVSDDCSKDNTVELCRQWIAANKNRFTRVVLLTVQENTGVCANGNRAMAACQGKWQKSIAADDILLTNCIGDFVDFVNNNTHIKWIASKVAVYNDNFKDDCCTQRNLVYDKSFFNMDVGQQLKYMACTNPIIAPSLFFDLEFKRSLGGYDETYGYEDRPFYIKALENGYKCYFLDKVTVGYRIHQSMSNSTSQLFNYSFLKKTRIFEREKCFSYLTKKQILLKNTLWIIQDIFQYAGLNRKKPQFVAFLYKSMLFMIIRMLKNRR